MKIKKYIKTIFTSTLITGIAALAISSCSKQKLEPVETYPDSPKPLVKFLDGKPLPAQGTVGSVVTFKITGLQGKDTSQFKFFINQTPALVVSVDSTSIKVIVPPNASTGGSSVLINGEYYFGPSFIVKGNVAIASDFDPSVCNSNNIINGIFLNDNSRYLVYGSFTDYGAKASVNNTITGLAELNSSCVYQTTNASSGIGTISVGKLGLNGYLSDVLQLPSSDYIIGGLFSTYNSFQNIRNITQIGSDGSLQTMVVNVVNPDPANFPDNGVDTVPVFNGGVNSNIVKQFYSSSTGAITTISNCTNYSSTFYERSTKGGPYLDIAKMHQVVRMNADGSLDSTFNFNMATKSSYDAGNGYIYDAIQLPDESIILVGSFTSFDGISVNHIVRIDATTGLIDPTFNTAGTGTDGDIKVATYNSNTGSILLTGNFKNYNGQPANGVVMIDTDGNIDPSFKFRNTESGIANYAGQMDDGKIIVSGTFNKYDGIVRPGLLILNQDGSLASGYNNTGLFRGAIKGFAELTYNGHQQVILVGSFDRFDAQTVKNIVKFQLNN
ncbi:MAG: DUF5008 domain-containing protein [Bacteroidetes bacterium]|nr:DUF5008 domain-containing protein [Bacteroidota bacterium]MBS1756676.1 DUF5008 domain-containing protein [Bacteroidota bacterium]